MVRIKSLLVLDGAKLEISYAHEGIKATVSKIFTATWQRCRVHFMRNVLARRHERPPGGVGLHRHRGPNGSLLPLGGPPRSQWQHAAIGWDTAVAQNDAEAASLQWRRDADQLRPKGPKLAKLMDEAEPDVLAYMTFPPQHRTKLHSSNPIERLNGENNRHTEVVGIFPNEVAITRLVGDLLLEQNGEWAVQISRCMTLESITRTGDHAAVSLADMTG